MEQISGPVCGRFRPESPPCTRHKHSPPCFAHTRSLFELLSRALHSSTFFARTRSSFELLSRALHGPVLLSLPRSFTGHAPFIFMLLPLVSLHSCIASLLTRIPFTHMPLADTCSIALMLLSWTCCSFKRLCASLSHSPSSCSSRTCSSKMLRRARFRSSLVPVATRRERSWFLATTHLPGLLNGSLEVEHRVRKGLNIHWMRRRFASRRVTCHTSSRMSTGSS